MSSAPFIRAIFIIPGIMLSALANVDTAQVYEIIVTASRIPSVPADANRSVTVIDRKTIESAPARSIVDLLEYAPGVDTRQRAPNGVQSDISIRGSTFEQSLVLIDGIKVSDVQTGHHNMNLPVSVNDIERIEILRGHGSRLYGPNAFGGVINIITRKDAGKLLEADVGAGEYGLVKGNASFSYPLGIFQQRLSLGKNISSGYARATDFNLSNIAYGSCVKTRFGEGNLLAGYADRRFGASTFYSDRFPNEWEHTNTGFLNAGWDRKWERIDIKAGAYLRQNKDDFMLNADSLVWGRNNHTTVTDGGQIEAIFHSGTGVTAIGGEGGNEKISSSNLGDHHRYRGGIYAEHKMNFLRRLSITPGVYTSYYSGWGWKAWPGLDMGFRFTDALKVFGSAGESFRVPTYTDLYYNSVTNKGNMDLKPEQSLNYEAGIRYEKISWQAEGALFRREGKDLIDWIRPDNASPWVAQNITSVNTNGFESNLLLRPKTFGFILPISRYQVSYTFLDSDKKAEAYQSKYVLDYVKHQFSTEIAYDYLPDLEHVWRARTKNRVGYKEYTLVDTKLSYRFRQIEAFVEATNLLDTEYQEITGVPMPGRWIQSGLKLNLNFK